MFGLTPAVSERVRDTRARLTKFYRLWNPSKLNEVNKIVRIFEGREMELWKSLKAKYVDRSRLPELQRERDEGIYTFILMCGQLRIPVELCRAVHSYSRNLHFWDYSGFRSIEEYYGKATFRNRDRALAEMIQFQSNPISKSLIDLGIDRDRDGRVVDLGDNPSVNDGARRIHGWLVDYMSSRTGSHMSPTSIVAERLRQMKALKLVFRACARSALLIDETYTLVMKQLNGNSDATEVYRGWQVMCLLTGMMVPSSAFQRFIRHFLESRLQTALQFLDAADNGAADGTKSSISASRTRFSQITAAYARFACVQFAQSCKLRSNTRTTTSGKAAAKAPSSAKNKAVGKKNLTAFVCNKNMMGDRKRIMAMQRAVPVVLRVVLPDGSDVCKIAAWPDETLKDLIPVALEKLKCCECDLVKYALAVNPRASLASIGITGEKSSLFYSNMPTTTIGHRRVLADTTTPGQILQWIAAPHLEYGAAGMMKGFGIPITDAEIKLPYARRFLKSRDTADIYTFTSIDPLGSWALGKARRKAQDVEDAAVKAQNDKDKRDGIRRAAGQVPVGLGVVEPQDA